MQYSDLLSVIHLVRRHWWYWMLSVLFCLWVNWRIQMVHFNQGEDVSLSMTDAHPKELPACKDLECCSKNGCSMKLQGSICSGIIRRIPLIQKVSNFFLFFEWQDQLLETLVLQLAPSVQSFKKRRKGEIATDILFSERSSSGCWVSIFMGAWKCFFKWHHSCLIYTEKNNNEQKMQHQLRIYGNLTVQRIILLFGVIFIGLSQSEVQTGAARSHPCVSNGPFFVWYDAQGSLDETGRSAH